MARFLFDLSKEHELVLTEIDGGNLRNAIPRAAHAVIGVHTSRKEAVRVALNEYVAKVENEYKDIEPTMEITMESVDAPEFAVDQQTTTSVIRALYSAPHGVVSMSRELEGLDVYKRQDSLPWIMIIAGFGMFVGNLLGGKMADKFSASLVSGVIATAMIPILVLIYVFASYGWAEAALTFLGTAGLFGIGGPMQYLIVRYAKGGEMLGAAGIQISFNLGNAIAAWIGGIAINLGFGYASPALAGVPLLIASSILLFYLYRRYERIDMPH